MAASKPITCRAAVVWTVNAPIALETVEVQPAGKGEVRVKMVAVGICHSDVHIWEGAFSDTLLPYVPGHEGAGVVESVGEGVTTVQPGDKVLTLCAANCGKCSSCKDERNFFCLDEERINPSGAFGRCLGFDGKPKFICKGQPVYLSLGCSSFAEYTVIPENCCAKISSDTNLEKACIFACAFPTGFGASTNSVKMKAGDVVGVWGLGGAGLPAVFGCKDQGVTKIIGINYSDRKREIARKFGCTDYVAIKNLKGSVPETIKKLCGNGQGLNYAIVSVGDVKAVEDALISTRPGGTVVVLGVFHEKDTITINPILFLLRKIVGCVVGNYKVREAIPKLVERYNGGELPADELISGFYKLDQINEVFDNVKNSKGIRSVVLMQQ